MLGHTPFCFFAFVFIFGAISLFTWHQETGLSYCV